MTFKILLVVEVQGQGVIDLERCEVTLETVVLKAQDSRDEFY